MCMHIHYIHTLYIYIILQLHLFNFFEKYLLESVFIHFLNYKMEIPYLLLSILLVWYFVK